MEQIDLLNFIPKKVISGKKNKEYRINIKERNGYLLLNYKSDINKEYPLMIPKFINKNNETFEVLGLLQAEMGKTNNGCINFCNHEVEIVKKVMTWFEKELEITSNDWRWYIKVNLNDPINKEYKKEIENKVINFWLNKTNIKKDNIYPVKVSYIKNTKNKKLKSYDYGTLILEYKNNLLSQIIKNYVKEISYNILNHNNNFIREFMKGIIAGESCIEINKDFKKYTIHICANDKKEKNIYQKCLNKLGIKSKQYKNCKDLIISKKENHLKLFQQKLICTSRKKYNKFLKLLKQYPNFKELHNYKETILQYPHNKPSQETINKILKICKENSNLTSIEIAKLAGVSEYSIRRFRRKYFGNRMNYTSKEKINEIINYYKNSNLTPREIAKKVNVKNNVVWRVRRRLGIISRK